MHCLTGIDEDHSFAATAIGHPGPQLGNAVNKLQCVKVLQHFNPDCCRLAATPFPKRSTVVSIPWLQTWLQKPMAIISN